MDVFVEYMVKRRKTAADFIKIILTLLLGLALVFVVTVLFAAIPFITSFILVAVAGVCYLAYRIITSVNVEYEYILTNSDLDVDAIISARKRKRLASINLRQIDSFGKLSGSESRVLGRSYKYIMAAEDKKAENTYYIVFDNDEEKSVLLFTPNEKIIKRIEMLNPQKGM